jgi:hypothetical protein
VKNDGNVDWAFAVGAEIMDGTTIIASDIAAKTTSTLTPGSSGPVTFTYTIPTGWTAKSYTFHAVVWTGPAGTGWLNDKTASFAATQVPLSLHGRIAYHSYSAWMATPVDSIDGNVFIYKLDGGVLVNLTDTLGLDNAMNPHFSPDGSKVTFMARPSTLSPAWANLEIYVYDLAEGALTRLTFNSYPDEDPKFSPDGSNIIFKRSAAGSGSGQIYRMNVDGSAVVQLTSSAREKSGPSYSPDGTRISFWYDIKSSGDIGWLQSAVPNSDTLLFGSGNNRQEMYPAFADNDNLLYSKWETADVDPNPPNPSDDVYRYTISSSTEAKMPFSSAGVEDADAYPVDATLCLFSSTRSGGKGSYDVYVARCDNGNVYTLSTPNSVHQDLGACYTPYSYARKLKVINPPNGATLTAGASFALQVCAYSDGGVWSGASPSVTVQGPSPQTYTDLRDDGTAGDAAAGDGIYSRTVTLPTSAGSYTIRSSAQSVEPGVTRQVSSASVTVIVRLPNSAPTGISLSASSVSENQPIGTAIATFSTTDPNVGDTFIYSLISGDTGAFSIGGSNLLTAAIFNYEEKNSYTVTVRTTDQGGLSYDKQFTVNVQNVNEAPTDINLSNASVAENLPAGTKVGSFSTTDPDSANTFTYSLISGDTGAFSISSSNLLTAAIFNYEVKSSYTVTVRSTDQGGLSYDKAFTITVQNVNETPTNIGLSNASVAENQPVGTTVGSLSTTDPDIGNTFTYTLVSGNTGSFTISGSNLLTAAVFDYEAKTNYSIGVRSTDQGGLLTEKVFSIAVINVNDFYKLVVSSAYGGATPAVGTNSYHLATPITGIVTNSPITGVGTQYVCAGWTGTGSAPANGSTTNTGSFNMTSDSTLVWLWTTNYWLDTATNGSGTVSVPDGWWPKGSNAQITAAAADHYRFTGWTGQTNGCTINSNVITVPMTAPRAITANFTVDQHSLVVTTPYGKTFPAAATNWYNWNSQVTAALTNSPIASGTTQYLCKGWIGSGSVPGSGTTTNTGPFTITNNSTIAWLWMTNYWLRVGTNGIGSVSVSDGWQAKGSNIVITATPGPHSQFSGWSGQTNGCTIAANVIGVPMTMPRAITANFITEEFELVVTSPYGNGYPQVGTSHIPWGTRLIASITNAPIIVGTNRYVCRGWVGTGSVPSEGTTTNTGFFTFAGDSSITWLWETNRVLDTQNPSVAILRPTAGTNYTVASGTIVLGGSASDNIGVVSVRAYNNRIWEEYDATGTTTWAVQAMPVFFGMNRLSVVASDAEGNTSTDNLDVYCSVVAHGGLRGLLYTNDLFGGKFVQRVDPQVSFDWGYGTPDPGIPTDRFSVRWDGKLVAPTSGIYTIYVVCNNGATLYLNGGTTPLITVDSDPTLQGFVEGSASVSLQQAVTNDISLLYHDSGGEACVQLLWEGPGIEEEPIDEEHLIPAPLLSTPYKGILAPIPGRVEMEKFDEGGPGVAYVDTYGTVNGGKYRPGEGVDLAFATTGVNNQWYVRDVVAGEWLQYTVKAAKASNLCTVSFRYKSAKAGGKFHVELDGKPVGGSLLVKATAGLWVTVKSTAFPITAGEHKIRVVMDANGLGGTVAFFDSVTFAAP